MTVVTPCSALQRWSGRPLDVSIASFDRLRQLRLEQGSPDLKTCLNARSDARIRRLLRTFIAQTKRMAASMTGLLARQQLVVALAMVGVPMSGSPAHDEEVRSKLADQLVSSGISGDDVLHLFEVVVGNYASRGVPIWNLPALMRRCIESGQLHRIGAAERWFGITSDEQDQVERIDAIAARVCGRMTVEDPRLDAQREQWVYGRMLAHVEKRVRMPLDEARRASMGLSLHQPGHGGWRDQGGHLADPRSSMAG